jgi:hypothetical protein
VLFDENKGGKDAIRPQDDDVTLQSSAKKGPPTSTIYFY